MPDDSDNYAPLQGSERRAATGAKLLGPAESDNTITVTVMVRRRKDGPPMPEPELHTPQSERRRMPPEEFAAKYGAADEDFAKVADFARSHGLTVVETHPARRTMVLSGTIARMSSAFQVKLGLYEHTVTQDRSHETHTETYRGREGSIYMPKGLHGIVEGVFGLDNRNISKRNAADPPNTTTLTTTHIAQLYNFPTNSAAGQTIGIVSMDGYQPADIAATFGGNPPSVTDVPVDANNSGNADGETTQDICIAGLAAPGAAIAVYFQTGTQQGWVEMLGKVANPEGSDPHCSVISSSFYISNGDDSATLAKEGITAALLDAVSAAFQDAGVQGVTVCIACGDTGSNSKVNDGKAHVQFPGSCPWVLSIGGTTIGNVNGSSFDEYVWNDPAPSDPQQWGTTGGGISDHFNSLPSWQAAAGVPQSVNDGHVGRGIPDVSANASLNSGYSGIVIGGNAGVGNGTSASSPLWAGLIAVINAALGHNVGFVNPALYALGSSVFRDIVPGAGPMDNSNAGVTGYPAGVGWDACTGWGSPNGAALLAALQQSVAPVGAMVP